MKRIVLLLAAGIVFAPVRVDASADLETLQTNFVRLELRGDMVNAERSEEFVLDEEKARRFVADQRTDGSWSAVDYAGRSLSAWAPSVGHLSQRTLYLARAYRRTQNKTYAIAARRGLDYWVAAKLKCPNWWWNQIGAPQIFGVAALMIDETLTAEDRARYADYLEVADVGKRTGQNRVWLARIMMMRGLLRRDEALVDRSIAEIANEVRVGETEGPQVDGSFRQHGPQMQFGNYGASYIINQARLAAAFAGTKWAYAPERMKILATLLDDGYRWIDWKGRMDVAALGRQLSPTAQERKASVVRTARRELAEAGAALDESLPLGFRAYPSSAYAVYRTANWMASVKMHTSQILETETWVNGENTLGAQLSDGALYCTATGREYENIFPLWKNWRLIPGVTSYRDEPTVQAGYKEKGGANEADDIRYVSGSDGTAEVHFMLKREGLAVRKHWRFGPDGVTAWGEVTTPIDPKKPIVTCVEHARAAENVEVREVNGRVVVHNGAFVYEIDAPKELVHVAVEEREGDYTDIYPPACGPTYRGQVLLVTIDQTPDHPTYLYRITAK